jgi:tetratricopeptide (TPR) repeat protein
VVLVFVLHFVRHVLPSMIARKGFAHGTYDQALRHLKWLERLHLWSPSLLYFKGTILMFAGRDREAEAVLRECLARDKRLGLVNLGYVLLSQRRFAEAAQALDEAIRLEPKKAVAYSSRAEVYLQQGIEPQKAIELLERGIEYKRTDTQSRVDLHIFGYLFANRAWALFLLDRQVEAEAAVQEAGQAAAAKMLKPGRAGVHYHIGKALVAGGQVQPAMQHFRQAREIDPDGRYAALSEVELRRV